MKIAIVDPYSTGKFFAKRAKQAGIDCIVVHSKWPIPKCYEASYCATDFAKSLVGKQAQEILQTEKVCAVIAGIESGVELADFLAAGMGLICNQISTSKQRRNKYLMQEALKKNGLASITQFEVTSEKEFEQALEQLTQNGALQIVLKPLNSAGTDGVFISDHKSDLLSHFRSQIGMKNSLGENNSSLLVQECLQGDEYMYDTFSSNGEHTISNICKLQKIKLQNKFTCYWQLDLRRIQNLTALEQKCVGYIFNSLDALGIQFGAVHSEVFISQERICLVETGARVHGGSTPVFIEQCVQNSQINEHLMAFLPSEAKQVFLNSLHTNVPQRKFQHLRLVFVVCPEEQYFSSLDKVLDAICLESEVHIHKIAKEFESIPMTKDVFTCPGWFVLLSDSLEEIERDTLALRAELLKQKLK